MYKHLTEPDALALVKSKKLRVVCPKRKRKLQKKGIRVFWSITLDCYVWEPLW